MPNRSTSPTVGALVLAAGASSRMGRAKALLDWDGKPLLQHQIDELLAAGCDPVVVVLGHESRPIEEAVDRTDVSQIVINTQHMSGRASSVRVGMAVLNDATVSGAVGAVIIASVDTPCSASTARLLARTALVRAST